MYLFRVTCGTSLVTAHNLIIRQIAIYNGYLPFLFARKVGVTVAQRFAKPSTGFTGFVGSTPAPSANIAVWSSRSARSIFNREAVGSNPTTAPNLKPSVMAK